MKIYYMKIIKKYHQKILFKKYYPEKIIFKNIYPDVNGSRCCTQERASTFRVQGSGFRV